MRKRSLTKRRKHRRQKKNRRNKTRIKKPRTKTKKRKKRSRKKNVLKGGGNCLCDNEHEHEQTVKNMLSSIVYARRAAVKWRACTASKVVAAATASDAGREGNIVRWYIVGHGAWKTGFEREKSTKYTSPPPPFGGESLSTNEQINNNALHPLAKNTYIITHTKLGTAMLQTAILYIIAGEEIPSGRWKKSAGYSTIGMAAVRYQCFDEEIRIYPTEHDDLMATRGASSGLYYDGKILREAQGIPNNICRPPPSRSSRIMGGKVEGISIHSFISDIMDKVNAKWGGTDVTLYIHLLCCLTKIP
jgi:hypothetical protein